MSQKNECENDSKTGWWSATKGIFKTISCGINVVASAAEAAALTTSKLAQQSQNSANAYLVETLKIKHKNGSEIDDAQLVHLIVDAYRQGDYEKLDAIAKAYDLNLDEFNSNQKKIAEMKKYMRDQ